MLVQATAMAFSQRDNDNARRIFRQWCQDRWGDNWSAAARDLHLAQPTIWNFANANRGLGAHILRAVAMKDPDAALEMLGVVPGFGMDPSALESIRAKLLTEEHDPADVGWVLRALAGLRHSAKETDETIRLARLLLGMAQMFRRNHSAGPDNPIQALPPARPPASPAAQRKPRQRR